MIFMFTSSGHAFRPDANLQFPVALREELFSATIQDSVGRRAWRHPGQIVNVSAHFTCQSIWFSRQDTYFSDRLTPKLSLFATTKPGRVQSFSSMGNVQHTECIQKMYIESTIEMITNIK